jgi:hypothetical protein
MQLPYHRSLQISYFDRNPGMRFINFLIVALITSTCFGQNKKTIIQNIRTEFQRINNLKGYKIIVLDAEDFLEHSPDGGGELKGYYNNDTLKKIVVSVGLSNGIETHEFYFKKNQLIFVYETFSGFVFDEKKKEFDYTKTERNFEGRYYFNNGKLIDYITMGHNRFEDDTLDPEKILLKEANEYSNLLSKKKQK